MFKNKFKEELSHIKPSPEKKQEILANIQAATTKPKKEKEDKVRRFPRWVGAIAACLAVAIICVAVFGNLPKPVPTNGEQTITDTAVIPATISYDAVYQLFNSIYKAQQPKEPTLLNKITYAIKGAFGGIKGSDEIVLEDMEESIDIDINLSGTTGAIDEGATNAGDSAINNGNNNQKPNTTEPATAPNNTEEHSGTNNQVYGVEEADVIKTDGKYIYAMSYASRTVNIAKVDKGNLLHASCVSINNSNENSQPFPDFQLTDLYISKDRMVVIGLEQSKAKNGITARTVTMLYDITDRFEPILLEEFAQSGYNVSSRLTNGVLYVFSNVSYYSEPNKSDLSTYIPQLYDSNGACPIEENSICIFDGEIDRQYMLATSVDIDKAERVDSVSVLGGGDTIYANTESIYVAAEQCTYSYLEKEDVLLKKYENTTRLIRLSIKKGELTAAAEGYVRGSILNQFSMDEYQNHFRIVTTVNGSISEDEDTSDSKSSAKSEETSSSKNNTEETAALPISSSKNTSSAIATMDTTTTNALFVLDSNLKQVGKIINLAPGERVYSVRFMRNYGYFVTFRNVDPLFAVDLTNPTQPKVLSALKIPGFSNYLHPYGDGLLLGIGKNADETNGRTDTVKLSMFDISDPANVTERDKTSLDCFYTQVDATHKAALIDSKRNLIAFMGSDAYYVYGYTKENGFVQKARLQVNWMDEYDVRGIYIGDYFYICTPKSIDSYTLNNFQHIESLVFDKTN